MASTAITINTLDADTFARVVLEKGLKVEGPIKGFRYALERTSTGDVLYKTSDKRKRYFYSYRAVCTQDNAGGGNLVCQITPAEGQYLKILGGYITASGNRAAQTTIENADAATIAYIAAVGAVANASATFAPAPGAASASSTPQEMHNKPIAYPSFAEGVITAAAQTETATIVFYAELSSSTKPTVSWAASGGTPNASAATEDLVTEVEEWP